MAGRKANYELVRQPFGKTEVRSWRIYMEMKDIERGKTLAPSEKKRKSKALLHLIRAGVLRQISDGEVRRRAEMVFRSYPWWKRGWIRFKFTFVWIRINFVRLINRGKNTN